jgi:hypothetical protein
MVSAKRFGAPLRERQPELRIRERAVRRLVGRLRGRPVPPEAFVPRSLVPSRPVEAEFGEPWFEIGGDVIKGRYLVATLLLPSNVHFPNVQSPRAR